MYYVKFPARTPNVANERSYFPVNLKFKAFNMSIKHNSHLP